MMTAPLPMIVEVGELLGGIICRRLVARNDRARCVGRADVVIARHRRPTGLLAAVVGAERMPWRPRNSAANCVSMSARLGDARSMRSRYCGLRTVAWKARWMGVAHGARLMVAWLRCASRAEAKVIRVVSPSTHGEMPKMRATSPTEKTRALFNCMSPPVIELSAVNFRSNEGILGASRLQRAGRAVVERRRLPRPSPEL
jgi:hypothetical protein